jgi:hypothetical protein
MKHLWYSILTDVDRNEAATFLMQTKMSFELHDYRVYFPGLLMIGQIALISFLVVCPYPIMSKGAWDFLPKFRDS